MNYRTFLLVFWSACLSCCLGKETRDFDPKRCVDKNHTCAKYRDCPHLLYDLSADEDRKTIDAMKLYCGERKSGRRVCCSEVEHAYLPETSQDSQLLPVNSCGYSSTNLINKDAAEYLRETTPIGVRYCEKWQHVPYKLVPSQKELEEGVTVPDDHHGYRGRRGYDSNLQNDESEEASKNEEPEEPLRRKCAVVKKPITRKHYRKRRMAGGRPSRVGQWPWMARIIFLQHLKRGENYEGFKLKPLHRCYGVIISARWVLSGAQCFTPSDIINYYARVRVGDHDFANSTGEDGLSEIVNWHIFKDIPKPKLIRVMRYFRHPDYKKIDGTGLYYADLTLILLEFPVQFNDYVNPICLPTSDAPPEAKLRTKEYNVAVGGSMNAFRFPIYQNPYAYVHLYLPVLDMKECEKAYGVSKLSDKKLVCAGGRIGQQLCQRDQASPLMIQIPDGRWFLVGLQTPNVPNFFKEWCDKRDRPSLFTKVYAYMDWIVKTMETYNDFQPRGK